MIQSSITVTVTGIYSIKVNLKEFIKIEKLSDFYYFSFNFWIRDKKSLNMQFMRSNGIVGYCILSRTDLDIRIDVCQEF